MKNKKNMTTMIEFRDNRSSSGEIRVSVLHSDEGKTWMPCHRKHGKAWNKAKVQVGSSAISMHTQTKLESFEADTSRGQRPVPFPLMPRKASVWRVRIQKKERVGIRSLLNNTSRKKVLGTGGFYD